MRRGSRCPFIGTRMRASQTGQKHGSPQRWAQSGFYACTVSVCVQTLFVILLPFCSEWGARRARRRAISSLSWSLLVLVRVLVVLVSVLVLVLGCLCLVAMNGGIVAAIVDVYLMTPGPCAVLARGAARPQARGASDGAHAGQRTFCIKYSTCTSTSRTVLLVGCCCWLVLNPYQSFSLPEYVSKPVLDIY